MGYPTEGALEAMEPADYRDCYRWFVPPHRTVVDELRLPTWIWGAGVDSGLDFDPSDAPNQPKETVRPLTHPHFLKTTGLMPIWWVMITRREP